MLVHIVVPSMGLQTPLAPWLLSLAPSLGTLCSVQWMAVSIHFFFCQALAEPLRRQQYQAPISKLFLASTILFVFGGCLWHGSPGGAVSGFIPSVSAFNFVSVTPSKGILFPLLRRIKVSTLWSSFFLSFRCFASCILGIVSFRTNINLLVREYHVCCFVTGLPHLG